MAHAHCILHYVICLFLSYILTPVYMTTELT